MMQPPSYRKLSPLSQQQRARVYDVHSRFNVTFNVTTARRFISTGLIVVNATCRELVRYNFTYQDMKFDRAWI